MTRRLRISAGLLALLALLAAALLAQSAPAQMLHATRVAASTEVSTNWAGYAVTGLDPVTPTQFTSVTGTWTQSTATCNAGDGNSASAVWVGLGGYDLTAQTLEQVGTDADCDPSGPATYYAWYELVPSPPVSLTLKINPGDVITASVNANANTITLQIIDRTRHTRWTKHATVNTADLTSAEWIAEAPSTCTNFSCSPLPLADFGTLNFSRIATIGNGHPGTLTDSAWHAIPIQLVPNARGSFGFFPGPNRGFTSFRSTAGTSEPAGLSPDGRSFSLSWLANPAVAATG